MLLLAVTVPNKLLFSQSHRPEQQVAMHSISSIRFFYEPSHDAFHPAMLLQAVRNGDKRLGTVEMKDEGDTLYLLESELTTIVEALMTNDLKWSFTKQVQVPGSYTSLLQRKPIPGGLVIRDGMEIRVFSTNGTLYTLVKPEGLCAKLATLDTYIGYPRVLWEMQFYRMKLGCEVQGFNREAYSH